MKYCLTSATIGAVIALAGASSALAGEISATVTPVFEPVSLSIGGSEPLASYKVKLTNTGSSNTLNNPRFVGTTTVTNGNAGAKAAFKLATVYTCTPRNADNTSIDCVIPPLPPGESSQEFTVTFTAPASGEKILFSWQAVFDLGKPPGNSNGEIGTQAIALAPIDPDKVTSDVPANLEVTFFTGGGIATKDDSWVTKVKVPASASATTAQVSETVRPGGCAGDLTTCSKSTLTIPGNFPGFLEITLLRDASTIANGAKIASARIYYSEPTNPALGVIYPLEVPDCRDTWTHGPLPKPGIPCEDRTQRFEFPKKSTPKTYVAPGFESDWRFVFRAVDNGSYEQ